MATTFGVSAGDHIRPFGPCRIQHFPEDSGQTFGIGDVLIQGGAGVEQKVKIATSNPTAGIVGIAAGAASGVAGTLIPVWLAEPDCRFIGRGLSDDALDFSDVGAARALETDSTTKWRIETDDAGNDCVVVLQFLDPTSLQPMTAEGDFIAAIVFRFIRAATLWGDDDNA